MSQMEFHKKKKAPSRGKGFYVALALCILSVGAVSWLTFGTRPSPTPAPQADPDSALSPEKSPAPSASESTASSEEKEPEKASAPEKKEEAAPSASKETGSIPKETPSSTGKETTAPSTPTAAQPQEKVQETAATPTSFIVPVAGKVIKEYSPNTSLYSLTFGDWRTHQGVDLAATKGSNVKSVADGTVSSVYVDDLLGTVVAVKYGDLEVSYCGMSVTPTVKVGEEVKQGQVLGALGEIPCECVEESHLHLEVKKDGSYVDPMETLGKGSSANR